jgi:AAA15 family ATPase/GTPase
MEGLAQVNLIAGKNNTGKTALLEAVRILESKGNITVINHIIKNRGQFTPSWKESYESIYNRNAISRNGKEISICIGDLKIDRKLIANTNRFDYKGIYHGVKNKEVFDLNPNESPDFPQDWVVFIPFSDDGFPLQSLWDKIVLTPLEDDVVGVLKAIEPAIIRIDVKGDSTKIRLSNEPNPLPLKNLGDGVLRVLNLAVGLVSAKDNTLLIDEFESGLHHSVQEQLWEIIFEYAQKWNIQVFATTHSMDAVETFYYVLNQDKYKDMGKFFRLQKSSRGPIEAIAYTESDLELALEANLEPR